MLPDQSIQNVTVAARQSVDEQAHVRGNERLAQKYVQHWCVLVFFSRQKCSQARNSWPFCRQCCNDYVFVSRVPSVVPV